MLRKTSNLIRQKKGMTLIEVMTAMTILTLMIFCFAPLFLSYFKTIDKAGEKIQETYLESGKLQQVINHKNEDNFDAYGGYFSGQFDNEMVIKSKTDDDKAVSFTTKAQFLGSDPAKLDETNFNSGLITLTTDFADGQIQCFPMSITDDFKEKQITIAASGNLVFNSKQYSNKSVYKLLVTNSDKSKTELEYGKDYELTHYKDSKGVEYENMLLLTLRGGSNICFEKSPLVFSYKNGAYEKEIQIDAPTAIMVGEKASDGKYYYYVTRGHIDENGELEIIRKEMIGAPLTSAMNDVSWVPAAASDGYKDTDGANSPTLTDQEKYGYYIMCGDNGQVRRFWRNENTGNYYWGGDFTYKSDIKLDENTTDGKQQYVHGTKEKDTSVYYAFSSQGVQSDSEQNGFNLSAVRGKAYLQCLSMWTVTSEGTHYYYASDGKTYHVQGKKGDTFRPQYVLPYSIMSTATSNTKYDNVEWGGVKANYYLENWENLSSRSTYNYGHESTTWLVENTSAPAINPITLTCADAIVITNPNYTNVAENSYEITNAETQVSSGLSYPSKSYNLYCGYIPAVMDAWSRDTSASTSFEDAVLAQDKGTYNTLAKGSLTRKDSNFKNSLAQKYAKWRGTFGMEPTFTEGSTFVPKESGQTAYYKEKAKSWGEWDYSRIYVWHYPYTNVKYVATGKVGDTKTSLGSNSAGRLFSTFENKQMNFTNGKVIDITAAYLSHPFAVHIAANPTDDMGYDYSNDKDNHIHYWNNRRETVTYLDCASVNIPSGEDDVNVSLMVGYVMSGMSEDNDDDMYANSFMHNGIVMLRSGAASVGINEERNNKTYEYYAKDKDGYLLSTESNVFHQFYYLNSRTTSSVKPERSGIKGYGTHHVGNLFGANYWANNRHIDYISLNGGEPDNPNATKTGNYNYIRCHPLSNTEVNCVEWGFTWDDKPEAMWGTENGTLLSWDIDVQQANSDANKNKKYDPEKYAENYNDRTVDAEFQSYRWILNVSGVNGNGGLGDAKEFAVYGNTVGSGTNYKETVGAHWGKKNKYEPQKFVLGSLSDVYLEFYDKWSRKNDIWKKAGFISVLESINDIEFADDIWVAAGDQSGQDPATFCPSGTTKESATVKPYKNAKGDGKGGSWINVRTWHDVKGTGKYIEGDVTNTEYFWSAVQISTNADYNIQQINCINGIWIATGYVDGSSSERKFNDEYDDGEKTVICWTRDPSIPCGKPGGWSESVAIWDYVGDTSATDVWKELTMSEVGGINSVAARD